MFPINLTRFLSVIEVVMRYELCMNSLYCSFNFLVILIMSKCDSFLSTYFKSHSSWCNITAGFSEHHHSQNLLSRLREQYLR